MGSVRSGLHQMRPRYGEHIRVTSRVPGTRVLEYWNRPSAEDDDVEPVPKDAY